MVPCLRGGGRRAPGRKFPRIGATEPLAPKVGSRGEDENRLRSSLNRNTLALWSDIPEETALALPLEVSKRGSELGPQIDRVSYTHDAMIDLVLQNPMIDQNDIAAHFGYTPAWVSIIFNSDAFQSRMAIRKTEIIDPLVRGQVEEAIKGLVSRSVAILREKLDNPNAGTELALEVFKASTRAAGYGARTGSTTINVNSPGSLVNILSGMDAPQPAGLVSTHVIEAEVVK